MEMNDEQKRIQMIFAEKTRFCPSKGKILFACALIFLAIVPILGLAASLMSGDGVTDELVPTIMAMLFCLFLILLGILIIRSYFDLKKKMNASLEKYGEEKIRNSIRSNLLWFYSYTIGSRKVFFHGPFYH